MINEQPFETAASVITFRYSREQITKAQDILMDFAEELKESYGKSVDQCESLESAFDVLDRALQLEQLEK